MKKTVAVVFAMVLSWGFSSEAATIVGFTGPYAPENWTTSWGGTLGAPRYTEEKFTLPVAGSGGGIWISVKIFETGTITFDAYENEDVGRTSAGFFTSVSGNGAGIDSKEGTKTQTINVVAGETLRFGISLDFLGSVGQLHLTNFKAEGAPDNIPEPSALGMVGTALVGALGFRRQRG